MAHSSNVELLTPLLAEQVMGWRVTPDRFMLGNREWKPRHYFQPTRRFHDALLLLESAKPDSYTMGWDKTGLFKVRVKIAGKVGEACRESKALAIALAVAQAVGIAAELSI
jgi:hypothetical protein